MDISDEPDHILQMYGPDAQKPGTYAANCIQARRLIEKDVRFVQLYHMGWDIKVYICSTLPAIDFPWSPGLEPAPKVIKLNTILKDY